MVPLRQRRQPRWGREIALLVVAPVACSAQFGGGGGYGGGGFGGGGYDPPAPICKMFKCPKGEKPVGNSSHQLWSYGCKDSGINFMSMASLDPNNPLGGMNQGKNVDKCCVERDICKQTCGTTSKQCHDEFQKCSKKICKGDQNCQLSAMMSDIKSDPEDEEEKNKPIPEEYDYEKNRQKRDCGGYEKNQKAACQCVPDDDWQMVTDSNLKAFYKAYNPEKLNEEGEITDIESVWSKWKGKEPQMFQALATKYKKNAVESRIKPKAPAPPPYEPPPPLSKEEQEKEDKESAKMRAKWAKEDEKRDAERAEKEQKKREAKEEAEQRKMEEEEGETVEL